jgi:hypothetical protein
VIDKLVKRYPLIFQRPQEINSEQTTELLPAEKPSSPYPSDGSQKDTGSGDLDIKEVVKNARHIIEFIKQVGPVVNNLLPLLEILKKFNSKKNQSSDKTTSGKKSLNKRVRKRKRNATRKKDRSRMIHKRNIR